jgi:alpha-beta hydrolase superfamily lysophospholipase
MLISGFGVAVILGVVGGYWRWRNYWLVPTWNGGQIITNNLEKYDFDSLRRVYKVESLSSDKIEILGPIREVEDRRAVFAKATTSQVKFKSQGKWITGMINYYPEKSSLSKVIIMIRGYAEKAGYYSGFGSWRVADELAKAGYATISLDFLGYGGSDMESTDMMEARFEKVVNVLDLIGAVENLPWVDKTKIGIWAHSNGGQIALSVLEVTGKNYPTVLWAPMTNPFPQSIIDTANDLDDGGVAVKATLAQFEKKYDARRYAFENYYSWINAPVLILQGDKDPWCKVSWQEAVVNSLKNLGKQAELVIFSGAGHNLETKWEEGVVVTKNFFDGKIPW